MRLRRNRAFQSWLILSLLAAPLAACSGQSAATLPAPTVEPLNTITPLPVVQESTPVPTPQPTASGPQKLVIWWPEPLAPLNNAAANTLLTQQMSAFERDNSDILIDRRLKTVGEVGGIMSTLRSASIVAPGALPDLTLIRREDLQTAVQADLIQPMEGQVAAAIVGDMSNLSNSILALGQVNGQLYAVPYMLDMTLVAYYPEPDTEPYTSWRFEDVLARGIPLTFAAGNTNPLSSTFYAQYLSAGGTPPQNGLLTVNENALRTVLEFYQAARTGDIVDGTLVNYTSIADYVAALENGQVKEAVISSTLYLTLRAEGVDVLAAPLPTHSGQMTTVLTGWMWVMPTSNTNRQALATRFLEWMMDAERQGEYAESVHMLPSQRSALRTWRNAPIDIDMVTETLANAYLPLTANESGTTVRALQNALVAVLSGTRTAEQATQDVLDQSSG